MDYKKRQIKRREVPESRCQSAEAGHENPGLHPVLKHVLAARGCGSESIVADQSLARLIKPNLLKGMDDAVGILISAIEDNKKIVILGDFDVDGATSTALTLNVMHAMGHRAIDYVVPNRFEYGYGLSLEIIPLLAEKKPDVLMTVDNGISSIDGAQAAKEKGWQVLITDHHLPGQTLPQADAIVNPNQPGCEFPSKNLAGVGVAFYIMIALRAALKEKGWFEKQGIQCPNLSHYLDLVALGTVADVVPLDQNNRLMVHFGLERMRKGQTGHGIKALCEVAQRPISYLSASDLGFALGPRLNAAGRLDDMSRGIKCLVSQDPWEAKTIAIELNTLNKMRREIETEMKQQAEAYLGELLEKEDLPIALVLYEETWHQGVVGILASRVKESFHRPVIAFATTEDGMLKGSGRSIAGIHLKDILDAISVKHPQLVDKFGGHAMAAGLTLKVEHLDEFRRAFECEIEAKINPSELQGYIYTDGPLAAKDLTLDVAQLLNEAGPWGQAFPEPVFDGQFNVVHKKVLGDAHLKLALAPVDDQKPVVNAIAFNLPPEKLAYDWNVVNLVYKLNINRFRGDTSLQLMAEYLEPA